ncbi:MAG TPA: HigA family addiction module antitoxin [Bryobacteraceae bacterium]|nr:HigA family addiction module antitoxin [Bryobacteraceae bacterium]
MPAFLQDMPDPEKLRAFPLWRAHHLAGDRKGVWSLHVTRNWRLTFRIEDGEIWGVDDETIIREKTMRTHNPVHPGRFLRSEVIEAHNLSVTEAAKVLRVSRPTLSSVLNAKADLSGEMALRFEKAFGVDMDTLMRMQNSYDIAQTRSRAKEINVERYEPRPAA